jgi:hypothetical protein
MVEIRGEKKVEGGVTRSGVRVGLERCDSTQRRGDAETSAEKEKSKERTSAETARLDMPVPRAV